MKGLLAALALLTAFIAAPAHAAPLKAVASFSVLGDMVARIGGERIALKVLVGPDGDAHGFEPSPADASALAAAGIVFVNGLGFEPWMEKLAAASGYRGPLIAASAGVIPREMQEDGHTHTDPHAWQDLANGAIYVRNIEAALASADPAGKSVYEANAAALLAELAGLDRWTRAEIGAVPAAKRKVITSHDAFGYFAAAYGVTFIAPEGLSTDAEPGAGDLARLIDQIRHEGIKALFIENMSDPRLIRQIADETGVEVGGALYADALSEPGEGAGTYLDMFRHNVALIVPAMAAK